MENCEYFNLFGSSLVETWKTFISDVHGSLAQASTVSNPSGSRSVFNVVERFRAAI